MSDYPKEWTKGLEDELRAPFPRQVRMTRTLRGGKNYEYVPWNEYVKKVNGLVGVGGWQIRIVGVQAIGGQLVTELEVDILGVTKANVGNSADDEGEDTFGTPPTKSYANALKRTLALFGVGLDEVYSKTEARAADARSQSQREASSPAPPKEPPPPAEPKPTKPNPETPEPASDPLWPWKPHFGTPLSEVPIEEVLKALQSSKLPVRWRERLLDERAKVKTGGG